MAQTRGQDQDEAVAANKSAEITRKRLDHDIIFRLWTLIASVEPFLLYFGTSRLLWQCYAAYGLASISLLLRWLLLWCSLDRIQTAGRVS